MRHIRLLRLAFASAPAFSALTLLLKVTRWLILQEARHHPALPRRATHQALTACKRTVSGSISLPSPGCFSPFPHGTCSLSVSQMYLALPDGSGWFTQNYSCSALLRILLGSQRISCTGLSPPMVHLSRWVPLYFYSPHCSPTTPVLPKQYRFGLFPVRSPLLRKSLLFSLPPGT